MAKAAIIGFGTVGSGVYEILKNNNFKEKIGEDIEVERILDIRDFSGHEAKKLFTKEFSELCGNEKIDVVAETMGGLHPAYEYTKELLNAEKSVVTSNKELVATYGPELLELAKKNNVNYMFEASVGGGIPIIRPMATCLLSDNIEKVAGILNGTTNYILTEMFEKGKSFDKSLSDAQELGYAERNPAADVEGYDACRKIAILASLAWGKFVDYKDIPTEGITNISEEDVKYAEKLGGVIKLIGYAEKLGNKVNIMVRPMFVDKKMQLAGVSGVFNAIDVKGEYLGETMFYGRGAGKEATAGAVTADIIDCVKHKGVNKHNIYWNTEDKNFVLDPGQDKASYFVISADGEADFKKTKETNDKKAFITEKMSAEQFSEKAQSQKNIKSFIRVLEV